MLLEMLFPVALQEAMPSRQFELVSTDGAAVRGQVDNDGKPAKGAVILVAGTGPFDRDARFFKPGDQGGEGLFADLSHRLTARGISVVRYDKRGVRYGAEADQRIDRAVAVTATTDTMRDDLATVYEWTRSSSGLSARCVVLLGHSEGMAHIGRLAQMGAKAPAGVIGIGPLLTDPVTNFRWNFSERDAWSLRSLDRNQDGNTTNAEVQAGFERTPAAVNGTIAPYIHPDGVWSTEAISRLETAQGQFYDVFKTTVLAQPDDAPWPDADAPTSSFQWWKSWLLDEIPVATNLAHWQVSVRAHFGDLDSQVHIPLQLKAAESALGDRFTVVRHPDVGHSLGVDPTYGPMNPLIGDQVANDVEAALQACSGLT